MIDLNKLHDIHYQYPIVKPRYGKTFYCFDSLLRAAQTGKYKTLCFVAVNQDRAQRESLNFLAFLDRLGEKHKVIEKNRLLLYEAEIVFKSVKNKEKLYGYHGYIEDLDVY